MFNLSGEVIGINTAIYSPSGGSIGIGFAIPAAVARPIIEQLKATGKVERGWIGARIQPVTDEIAESVGLDKGRGAMIAAIDPGSPAAKAKLHPGDVILSYDGKPIDRSRQLPRLVADTPAGQAGQADRSGATARNTRSSSRSAALNPNRPAPPPPEPEKPKPPPTVDALGLKLAKVTPELTQAILAAGRGKGRRHHRGAAKRPRGDPGAARRRPDHAVGGFAVSAPDQRARSSSPRRRRPGTNSPSSASSGRATAALSPCRSARDSQKSRALGKTQVVIFGPLSAKMPGAPPPGGA